MTGYKQNRTFIRSIFAILLACLFIPLSAQTEIIHTETDSIQSGVVEESSQTVAPIIDFRVPDESKIKEYQDDGRFNYDRTERGASWWDKAKYEIFRFINRLFSGVADSGIMGIVLIVVLVLLLCLIILKVLGVDYRSLLGKKKLDTAEIDIYTENVHEMDFDSLISTALKNKDYRLVVRFLYLKSLKLLSDKEIIEWKPTKTNYSYQYEILDASLREKFLESTLIFDYIWYGEFALDETKFSDIYNRMDNFNKTIANER